MRVLLINPGFKLENEKERDNYVFPFGLAYVAAYAEKNGHEIEVLDIPAEKLNFNEVQIKIKRMDLTSYDIIGITGIVNQYIYVKKLSELLKKITNKKIVLGGPLSSYSWNIVLENTKVDICVIGEGEQTFLEILNGKKLSTIDGVIYKTKKEIKQNKAREQIKDLDSIGMPAFHLFDMEFYIKKSGMMDILRPYYKDIRSLPLITSRGCPYNCKFCSKSTRGVRMKSLDFLFKEIDYYKKEFGVKAVHFVDELLLLNKKRFLEFCQRIKKYDVKWDCQARINLVDEEILTKMKESNGACVGFGIESGSQKILDAMDKRIKVEDIKKYLMFCQKIGLPVKIQIIYGYPGENWETLMETVSLFKKVRLPGRRFGVITPLPGAPLYEEAKKDGFIGDSKDDVISEKEYIKFLSRKGGWATIDLFYNRTSFSDKKFYPTMIFAENLMFVNFLLVILLNPLFILRNFKLYRLYIRNWWRYRDRLFLIGAPKYIIKKTTKS